MKKTYYKNLFYLFVSLIILLIVFCSGNKKVFAAEQLDYSFSKYYPSDGAACSAPVVPPWQCPQVAGDFSFNLPTNYSDVYMHDLCWDDKVYWLKINGNAVNWGGVFAGCDSYGNHSMMQYVHSGSNTVYYDFRDTEGNPVGGSFNITAKLKPGDFNFNVTQGCGSDNLPVNIISWTQSTDADRYWIYEDNNNIETTANNSAGVYVRNSVVGVSHTYQIKAKNDNETTPGTVSSFPNSTTIELTSPDCWPHAKISGPSSGFPGQSLNFTLALDQPGLPVGQTQNISSYCFSDTLNAVAYATSCTGSSSTNKTFTSNGTYHIGGIVKVNRKVYDTGYYTGIYNGYDKVVDSTLDDYPVTISNKPTFTINTDCSSGTVKNILSWNVVSGGPYTYEIYRRLATDTGYPPSLGVASNCPNCTFVDSTAQQGKEYVYNIKIYNSNIWFQEKSITSCTVFTPTPTPIPASSIKLNANAYCQNGYPRYTLNWNLVINGNYPVWSYSSGEGFMEYTNTNGYPDWVRTCYPANNSTQCDFTAVDGYAKPGTNITFYFKFYGVTYNGINLGTVESEHLTTPYNGNTCTGDLNITYLGDIEIDLSKTNYAQNTIAAQSTNKYSRINFGYSYSTPALSNPLVSFNPSGSSANGCYNNYAGLDYCALSFNFYIPSTTPAQDYKVWMQAAGYSGAAGEKYISRSFSLHVKNGAQTNAITTFKGFFIGEEIKILREANTAPYNIYYDPVAAQNPPPGFADLLAPFWKETTP